MDKLDILSISGIKELLMHTPTAKHKLYLSNDIGLAIGINEVFRKMIVRPEPFIVNEARFVLVTKGHLKVTVNLREQEMRQGMIGYIGRGSVVQTSQIQDIGEYDGIGMIISDETLRMALHNKLPQSLNGTDQHFFAEADAAEQQTLNHIMDALWNVIHLPDNHTRAIHSLLCTFIYLVDDIRMKNCSHESEKHPHERDLFDRFIMLVNHHSAQEHHLPFYADQLCISEKYLSNVVKQASGTTAKNWIDRALVTAAKVMLRHSDLQVSQISDTLNFPNTSFFCKYFKRITHISPLQYREERDAQDIEREV